jgi:hypothetical protein
MTPRLREDVRPGKVNGLSRPPRAFGRHVKVPQRHSMPLLAVGAGLYVVSLAIPVFLHEVSPAIVAGAFAGTLFVLLGLHHRWTHPATVPE